MAGFVKAQSSAVNLRSPPFLPWTACSSACVWFRKSRRLTNHAVKTLPLAHLWRGDWPLHPQFSKANMHRRDSCCEVSWQSLKIQSKMPDIPMQSKWSMQLPLIFQREATFCIQTFIALVTSAITCSSAFWVMLIARMNLLVIVQVVPHYIFPPGLLGCCNAPWQDSAFIGSLLESSLSLNQSSRWLKLF